MDGLYGSFKREDYEKEISIYYPVWYQPNNLRFLFSERALIILSISSPSTVSDDLYNNMFKQKAEHIEQSIQ